MATTRFIVEEMSCEGCEEIITNALSDVDGVESVETDHEESLVVVEGDADPEELAQSIDFAGYDGERVDGAADEGGEDDETEE